MGTLLFFLAEAEALEEGGFGLNFDLLDTNLINLVIIIGVLIFFGRKFLGETLSARQQQIRSSIQDAEERKKKAAAELAEQQQRLAQAKTDARKLLDQAEQRAESARQAILAQAEKDIERLRADAQKDLTSQQERIAAELRQRVAELALQRVEERLKSELDETAQQRLVDQSIAMLGG